MSIYDEVMAELDESMSKKSAQQIRDEIKRLDAKYDKMLKSSLISDDCGSFVRSLPIPSSSDFAFKGNVNQSGVLVSDFSIDCLNEAA